MLLHLLVIILDLTSRKMYAYWGFQFNFRNVLFRVGGWYYLRTFEHFYSSQVYGAVIVIRFSPCIWLSHVISVSLMNHNTNTLDFLMEKPENGILWARTPLLCTRQELAPKWEDKRSICCFGLLTIPVSLITTALIFPAASHFSFCGSILWGQCDMRHFGGRIGSGCMTRMFNEILCFFMFLPWVLIMWLQTDR